MTTIASSRDTVELSRRNTFSVYKTVSNGRKNIFHVYKTISFSGEKVVCIRSHSKDVIIDLRCNRGYSAPARGGADLFSYSWPLTRPVNFWRRGFYQQCLYMYLIMCVCEKRAKREGVGYQSETSSL